MSTYDAGSIEGKLTLDRTPFTTGLREAQRQQEEFERRRFASQLDVDTGEADAKIVDISERLDRASRDRTTTIHVREDYDRSLARLFPGGSGGGVGGGGVGGIGGLGGAAASEGGGLGGMFSGGLTSPGVLGLIASAVPALNAMGSVGLAGAGGLATGFASAASAAGAFAAIAIPAYKQVTKAQTNLKNAQEAYAKATTDAARKSALAKEAEAKKILDSFAPVTKGIDDLRAAFDALTKPFQGAVFDVMAKALKDAATILPELTPIFKVAASSVGTLVDTLAAGFTSGEFKTFVDFLAGQAGPAMKTFADVIVSVGKGIAGVMVAFGPELPAIEGAVTRLAKSFADWGQALLGSPAITQFFTFVNQIGPAVTQTLGDMLTAVSSLLSGLRPAAAGSLTFWDTIFNVLGQLGRTVLPPLAQAFGDLLAALSPLLVAFGDVASELLPPLLVALDGLIRAVSPAIPVIALMAATFSGMFADALKAILPSFLQFTQTVAPLAVDLAEMLPLIMQMGAAFALALPLVAPLVDLLLKLATVVIRYTVVPAFNFLASTVIYAMGLVVDSLASAFGWLPLGIGKSLRDARDKFDTFRTQIGTLTGQLNGTIGTTSGPLGTLNGNISGLGPTMNGLGTPIGALVSNLGALGVQVGGLNSAVNASAGAWRSWGVGIGGASTATAIFNEGVTDAITNAGKLMAMPVVRTGTGGVRFRASGGRVDAFTPYVVGENRAELFVPDQPGYIVPSVTAAQRVADAYVQPNVPVRTAGATAPGGVNITVQQLVVQRMPGEPDDAPAVVRGLREAGSEYAA